MDRSEANALVAATLDELWQGGRKPVLGARLKLEVLRRSREAGNEFDEKGLGHLNFASFLDSVPGIIVHRRPGTDFLVVPEAHAAEVVAEGPRTRVRPDFWHAFVGFPIAGEVRAYSPAEDRVLAARDDAPLPIEAIPINPISKDRQLQWRVEFIRALGAENRLTELADRLTPEGGFAQFARALDTQPDLRPSWNAAWLSHVTADIRAWGEEHGVDESVWLVAAAQPRAGSSEDVRRRDLLDVLSRIPTEYLEQIEVKLGWLVGPNRRR